MSFKKFYPEIDDNIEYHRHYASLYGALSYSLDTSSAFQIGGLSTDDIVHICNFSSAEKKDTPKSTNLLNKAIAIFGEICKYPLFRGLSEKQMSNFSSLKSYSLMHNSSFSTSYYMAENFAEKSEYIITIKSCNKKIFDLSYFCKVVEQLVADFNLNLIYDKYATLSIKNMLRTNWLQAYIDSYSIAKKQNPNDPLLKYYYDRDVDQFRINEAIYYDEYEWLIPIGTNLTIVDKNKLIFKII